MTGYPNQNFSNCILNDRRTNKNYLSSNVCLQFDYCFCHDKNSAVADHFIRAKVVKNRHGKCSDWIVLMPEPLLSKKI